MKKVPQLRLITSCLMAVGLNASPLSTAVADEFAGNDFAPTAFTECSSEAFLTQGRTSVTYGINLLTGDYHIADDDNGGDGSVPVVQLNGLGFNPQDRFIYGWSYKHGQPARIHADYSVEPFGTDTNITNSNYYIGDVSITHNRYYVYRSGRNYGLYYFELDPSDPNYQVMQKVPNSENMNVRAYDIAFHPTSGAAYMVDRFGKLFLIDADAGTATLMGDTGEPGTYGAAYFDPNGNLYVSRNQDGAIFRIAIDAGSTTAEFFAAGPKSGINDGYRCAIADLPVAAEDGIDFGDAPDSYGTSLANNGARHGIADPSATNTVRLGSGLDGEIDAYTYPLSDNDSGEDEDGVVFISNIVQHQVARVSVDAPNGGILNAWIDVDQNGSFDSTDQVITDTLLNPGEQVVAFTVPSNLTAGDSWARFRISSVSGVEAIGGAPDGEVEDYKVTLVADPIVASTFPSRTGWATVAFEDNWPFEGDYDMNDLVTQLRTTTYRDSRGTLGVDITGRVMASGASYENGFAVRLPGIERAAVDEPNVTFTINDRAVPQSPLESDRKEAILIITENVFKHVGTGQDCDFYRTEPGCGVPIEFTFKVSIPFAEPQSTKLNGVFDPFLFATPGAFHGAHFTSEPGRAYEIHLKNQAPTEAFDTSLFANVGQDASRPEDELYYLTSNGMPWALVIGDDWLHPREHVEISDAYPKFRDWATSNGQQDSDWFTLENADLPLVYTE